MKIFLGLIFLGLSVSVWLSRRLAVESAEVRGRLWAMRQLLGEKTDS